jgi:hypothetical protein
MAKKMRGFAGGGDTSVDEEGKPIGPNEDAVKEYFSPTRGTMEDGKYTPPSTYESVKNVGKAAASMIPRGVARIADKMSGSDSEEPMKRSEPDPKPRVSDSESAAGEEVGRRMRGGDYYIEPGSYEKRSVESDRMDKARREKMAAAKGRSAEDKRRAAMEGATPRVGYKKGGMVSKKSGGSVRGAGIAQRGQGKMRMC